MSMSMTVTRGDPILVLIRKVDIPYTFDMPTGMKCTAKIRVPSLQIHDINITFPNPIKFKAAQVLERSQLQNAHSAFRATTSSLAKLAKEWATKQVDQTKAAAQIAKLNSVLTELIPNISAFPDSDTAIRSRMGQAILDESDRKQMLASMESFNKEAETLNKLCDSQPVPTSQPNDNKAKLEKVSKLALAFFLEFNDPAGHQRKQTRMFDWEHSILGKVAYPISQHPIKDMVESYEHTILLVQGLESIGAYVEQDTKLLELNEGLGGKPLAKAVAAPK